MADLRLRIAEDQHDSWVVPLLSEVASELGWSVVDDADAPGLLPRPDALAIVVATGTAIPAVDEPAFIVAIEAGTPRSPSVTESAAHLLPRSELVAGAFKARRNQQVTRAAFERFLLRVAQGLPEPLDGPAAPDPAEAVAGPDASAVVAENRALLDAVDAWLARTSMTPEAAQAIGADRAILEAAIGAPVIDLVIVERAASRLADAVGA